MKYCVLYPNTWNVNLVKEMGMIPYKLHKLYDYDAKIACYKNEEEYSYLEDEVKGLKIDFIKKTTGNYAIDGVLYLLKHSREIETLQIFHITFYSMCYAIVYKLLNKDGKTYLKLDCSHKLIDKLKSLGKFRMWIINYYLNKVDLISVEQKKLYSELKELLPKQKDKIINIPNGVDFSFLEENNIRYDYESKENIILNVARIGAEEKNTPLLLNAFSKIRAIENSGWKLYLVGPIEEDFKEYISTFYENNPKLKDIVIFKGEIRDRRELFTLYKKSKIFTLTSEFESFGISFIEAAALGNAIISTDVGIANEIVLNGGGTIVSNNNEEILKNSFEEYIYKNDIEITCNRSYKYCLYNYNWDKIINNLHNSINK
ncbi:glycosyltransferase family 4 protein [Hathewaya histolytica]|uniref:Glycosyltransferase n=1 Tax=Hathewaya histolytica TaxID=1498 RepID=A0A4V6KDZ7_HATHI|nr:glycosyltransferase family 4 protein [Hathewaya histolytica]VTQ92677.1 glycosyltransferase [Hathewaya histolytica]